MFVDEKAAGEVQEQKRGTLTLSEAIRIGAKIRPQGRGGCNAARGTSCALSAAHEAITGQPNTFVEYWSTVKPLAPEHVLEAVYRKNDFDGWTRERIADWLEARGY